MKKSEDKLDYSAKYVQGWKKMSLIHKNNGDYSWMNSFIRSYHNVLELGCGSGYSTLELVRDGHCVHGIDVLEKCIDNSNKLMNEHGIESRIKDLDSCRYFDTQAAFSLCDILDKNNWAYLADIPADVIVMTNPGTHVINISAENISTLLGMGYEVEEIGNLFKHKEALVRAAAEIARTGRKPFFLVDRNWNGSAGKSWIDSLENEVLGLSNYEERNICLKAPAKDGEKVDNAELKMVMVAALYEVK